MEDTPVSRINNLGHNAFIERMGFTGKPGMVNCPMVLTLNSIYLHKLSAVVREDKHDLFQRVSGVDSDSPCEEIGDQSHCCYTSCNSIYIGKLPT
jgi:hypothetical protein